jgi:hypothetical protein
VAFASVPLNEEDNPNALVEENNIYATPNSDPIPINKPSTRSQIEASMMESFFVVPRQTANAQQPPQVIINNFDKDLSAEKPIS